MNIALILAGGTGSRMGMKDTPKQFIDIYGKPLIMYTLEAFDSHPLIDYIAVSCISEWHQDMQIWSRKYELNKLKWIAPGGKTRQESVLNGLETIKPECSENDIIIVHDSARPLITHKIITQNIEGALRYGAVDTVIPASDTIIKSIDSKIISEVPIRKELYMGQTPQSFKYSTLYEAHKYAIEQNYENSTDDCQLVLMNNQSVNLVNGDKLNFKITTLEDLLLLKAIIKMGKTEMI